MIKSLGEYQSNREMNDLLEVSGRYLGNHIDQLAVDMRCIEHSLCEWDKYERVRLGQGKPRSKYHANVGMWLEAPDGGVA